MANLKRIAPNSIVSAIEKAERYRLLNEPMHAESICLDVLEIEPENQTALITLLLALTDQFPSRLYDALKPAEGLIPRLADEYHQHYFAGIINERWAIAQRDQRTVSSSVPIWLGKAMSEYEQAEALSDGKNPDAILRWNTCARLQEKLIRTTPQTAPLTRDMHGEFSGEVPPR
jgi:hypothetical protein